MIFLKNYSIKSKIQIISSFATIIILVLAFVTYLFTNYFKESLFEIQTKELQVKNISYTLKDKILNLHKLILTQSLLQKNNPDRARIEQLNKNIIDNFTQLRRIIVVTKNSELLETLEKLNIRYESYFSIANKLPKQFGYSFEEGVDSLAGINAISEKMFEELDFFIEKSNAQINSRIAEINLNMIYMMNIIVLISFLSLLIFILFGAILKNTILKSLKNLENGIEEFFQFLSQKISSAKGIEIVYNDELGQIASKINNSIHKAEILIENERKFKENLEIQVAEELEKNLKNELLLFEQSKMASMGEMIGNIAHQWRQPLSLISSHASSIILRKQIGILSDEELFESCNKISENTQRLSEIITTFRNYLMETKEIQEVVLQNSIKQSLEIINITLLDNRIKLIVELDEYPPINIKMVTGEFSEVIINIINNAKDILKEKKIENPWIKVSLKKIDEKVMLSIEDNGGGIPLEIIDKIFDQHFTTKDKSHGTGLGLYMSYRIVKESLHGEIYVQNSLHGAKFFIEIPIE